uniref:Uncharacterized protein n=1 Tax=Rhizophora mucronata TaxID=61149 RepID=A0A2P2Q869_RHIMU
MVLNLKLLLSWSMSPFFLHLFNPLMPPESQISELKKSNFSDWMI